MVLAGLLSQTRSWKEKCFQETTHLSRPRFSLECKKKLRSLVEVQPLAWVVAKRIVAALAAGVTMVAQVAAHHYRDRCKGVFQEGKCRKLVALIALSHLSV